MYVQIGADWSKHVDRHNSLGEIQGAEKCCGHKCGCSKIANISSFIYLGLTIWNHLLRIREEHVVTMSVKRKDNLKT